MEGKTRKAGMAVLGAGAVILLAAWALGCGPWSPLEARSPGWSSWKGRCGFHGRDFSEHLLKHMDEWVQALDLTDAQKKQYAAIRLKVESELTAGQEKRRLFMGDLRREMQKDLPDLHEVAGLVSEHVGVIPAAVDRFMNLFLEFFESLEENQKARVIEHLRDRLNRMDLKDGVEVGEGATQEGGPSSSGSLAEQIAHKRGDHNGELL